MGTDYEERVNAEASIMIRMQWSYQDLMACPVEHFRAINQLLKEQG